MKTKKSSKPPFNQYIRYTQIALQMAVIIGAGVFGGVALDKQIGLKFPVFTLVFSLLSVAIAIYISIREFLRKP